jgi:hypothetical protein
MWSAVAISAQVIRPISSFYVTRSGPLETFFEITDGGALMRSNGDLNREP